MNAAKLLRYKRRAITWLGLLAAVSGLAQTAIVLRRPQNAHTVCVTNLMVVLKPTTNSTSAAGTVYNAIAFNYAASDLYLMALSWNALTNAGTNGALPDLPALKVGAGSYAGWDWGPQGRNFTNGIVLAVSSTPHSLTNNGAEALSNTNFHFEVNYADRAY